MRDPALNIAGATDEDRRLWNSYVYWARESLGPVPDTFIVADPDARLSAADASALRAILFTAFALEYRLRSVYEALSLSVRQRDGLGTLLGNLQRRTEGRVGLNRRRIAFSAEWAAVKLRLDNLVSLRNRVAHGKRGPVAELLRDAEPSLSAQAVDGYNALIDAIRVINLAIGYESRRGKALDNYYSPLQFVAGDGA